MYVYIYYSFRLITLQLNQTSIFKGFYFGISSLVVVAQKNTQTYSSQLISVGQFCSNTDNTKDNVTQNTEHFSLSAELLTLLQNFVTCVYETKCIS